MLHRHQAIGEINLQLHPPNEQKEHNEDAECPNPPDIMPMSAVSVVLSRHYMGERTAKME